MLDVLLRKHRASRTSLGISVPVPANTGDVIEALMQGVLLRGSQADPRQYALFDTSAFVSEDLHARWDNVAEKERRSRTLFAQRTIKVDEVAQEWQAVREAIGTGVDVERFMTEVVETHGGSTARKNGNLEVRLPNRAAIREA